jgi:hypothetical protein
MLRDRAASYVRDANTFAASPDIADHQRWAVIYRAIGQELSKVADAISQRHGGGAILEPLAASIDARSFGSRRRSAILPSVSGASGRVSSIPRH